MAFVLMLSGAGVKAGDITWESTKALVRSHFPDAAQVSVVDLADALEGTDAPVLIDVREPAEYAVSHLPGAFHAQGAALRALVDEIGADRPVVLYCSVGYRSSREAQALRRKGFENVSNLDGSIFEWANTGHVLVQGGPEAETPTDFVHPFNDKWGVLLEADRRSYEPR
ncbi:MAG: rhodanese-like domain-containing protein [Pseudomonadota bacterium]